MALCRFRGCKIGNNSTGAEKMPNRIQRLCLNYPPHPTRVYCTVEGSRLYPHSTMGTGASSEPHTRLAPTSAPASAPAPASTPESVSDNDEPRVPCPTLRTRHAESMQYGLIPEVAGIATVFSVDLFIITPNVDTPPGFDMEYLIVDDTSTGDWTTATPIRLRTAVGSDPEVLWSFSLPPGSMLVYVRGCNPTTGEVTRVSDPYYATVVM